MNAWQGRALSSSNPERRLKAALQPRLPLVRPLCPNRSFLAMYNCGHSEVRLHRAECY